MLLSQTFKIKGDGIVLTDSDIELTLLPGNVCRMKDTNCCRRSAVTLYPPGSYDVLTLNRPYLYFMT